MSHDNVKNGVKFDSEVYSALSSLLKEELIRYELNWETEKDRLSAFESFEKFKQIFGTDLAKKAFKERLKNLKNLYKGTIVQVRPQRKLRSDFIRFNSEPFRVPVSRHLRKKWENQ